MYIVFTDTITFQNASCAGRNLMLDRELVPFASEKTNLDKSQQYYHVGRGLTVAIQFFYLNPDNIFEIERLLKEKIVIHVD